MPSPKHSMAITCRD